MKKLRRILQNFYWWVWLRLTREGRDLKNFIDTNGLPNGREELLEWEKTAGGRPT